MSINLKDIGISYERGKSSWALRNVDMEIPEGSIFGLLGPNGAGKTTLMRVLSGLLDVDEGEVALPNYLQDRKGRVDRCKVGLLLETPGIYGKLSVREYLYFFGQFYSLQNLEERIEELCSLFELPEHQKMIELSLGMKQKVQLARCLVHHPKLLLPG